MLFYVCIPIIYIYNILLTLLINQSFKITKKKKLKKKNIIHIH